MILQWYALRCKSRKEDIVWKQVRDHGHEVFYPRLRVNPVNPRSRKIIPYFPGYIFVHVNLQDVGLSAFNWMPHTIGLVSFGGEPASVPDNMVYAISQRVAEIAAAGGEVFDGLKKGDRVRIQMGPFEGYEAIFDSRLPGTERVRVFLQFLAEHRQVPVEMDSSLIKKR